jgi:arylsulfatase
VSDVYTEWRNPVHHPDIVARPKRTRLAGSIGFERNLVRATKGAPLQPLGDIDIPLMAQLDDKFTNFSVDFIKQQASTTAAGGAQKPWLLYHATTGCHFDNYPGVWTGASPAAFPYTDARPSMRLSLIACLSLTRC